MFKEKGTQVYQIWCYGINKVSEVKKKKKVLKDVEIKPNKKIYIYLYIWC